jgi:hypothetical protein
MKSEYPDTGSVEKSAVRTPKHEEPGGVNIVVRGPALTAIMDRHALLPVWNQITPKHERRLRLMSASENRFKSPRAIMDG